MSFITAGRASEFAILLITWILGIYGIALSRNMGGLSIPSSFKLRKLAAIAGIEEGIGRATEMGRPVHYGTSLGRPDNTSAPEFIASLSILHHSARLCARHKCRLIVSTFQDMALPYLEEAVSRAYLEEGVPDNFIPDDVRYASADQFAYASTLQAMLQRENVALQLYIGPLGGETAVVMGAIPPDAYNIGGTATLHNMAIMVANSQWFFLSAELFVAAAYLSGEEDAVGGLFGEDIFKYGLVAALIVGSIMMLAGNSLFIDLFKM